MEGAAEDSEGEIGKWEKEEEEEEENVSAGEVDTAAEVIMGRDVF